MEIKGKTNKFGLLLEVSLIIIGVLLLVMSILECYNQILQIVISVLVCVIGGLALRHNIRGGIRKNVVIVRDS